MKHETETKRVADLEGAELDYRVARVLGYRFWLERRGEYRLAVRQPPGAREPWGSRKQDAERYVEALRFADIQCVFFGLGVPAFSTEWQHGGPIIERERIGLSPLTRLDGHWQAAMVNRDCSILSSQTGPTPLIAAMRAFVASKFGETVEVTA